MAQGQLEGRLSKTGILAPLFANYLVLGKLHNPSTALYLNVKLIIKANNNNSLLYWVQWQKVM